jgi:hypothetical protein
MLETGNSERPNLWGVFLWPVLLIGSVALYLWNKKDIYYNDKDKEYYDEN